MDFTIVITTSPIKTNPDITMINCVINSIFKNIKTQFKRKIIISCDGANLNDNSYNKIAHYLVKNN